MTTLLTDPRARRDALDLLLPQASDLVGAWREAVHGRSVVAADLLAIADGSAAVPALVGGVR